MVGAGIPLIITVYLIRTDRDGQDNKQHQHVELFWNIFFFLIKSDDC